MNKPRMRADHPWRRRGEAHPASRLSDDERGHIRDMVARGFPRKFIANKFCVSEKTVQRVGK